MKILVIENTNTSTLEVVIDGVNFGVFDQMDLDGPFTYYPKRNDLLTGDHYIAIGVELNKLNLRAK